MNLRGNWGEPVYSEKIGDSINLAGPDKERLNNPDLSNAVSHGKVLKYQRRKSLPGPSCNYNHLGTCKFYNTLTRRWYFATTWNFFKSFFILF